MHAVAWCRGFQSALESTHKTILERNAMCISFQKNTAHLRSANSPFLRLVSVSRHLRGRSIIGYLSTPALYIRISAPPSRVVQCGSFPHIDVKYRHVCFHIFISFYQRLKLLSSVLRFLYPSSRFLLIVLSFSPIVV